MKREREKEENYIEKPGKRALKCIFLGYKLQKFSRGGLPTPLHNPPTNLFVENYIKNEGKCLKNASFWVINSKNIFVGEKN